MYKPKPVDLSGVVLPEELEELVEKSGSKKLVRSVDNYINLCGFHVEGSKIQP